MSKVTRSAHHQILSGSIYPELSYDLENIRPRFALRCRPFGMRGGGSARCVLTLKFRPARSHVRQTQGNTETGDGTAKRKGMSLSKRGRQFARPPNLFGGP